MSSTMKNFTDCIFFSFTDIMHSILCSPDCLSFERDQPNTVNFYAVIFIFAYLFPSGQHLPYFLTSVL